MRPSPLRHPLAVLRQIIGLTQKDFAKLVGKSTTTIQAIELGKLQLSKDLAVKISVETGVAARWLLEGDVLKPPVSEEPVTKERTLELEFTKKYFEKWRADQIKEGYGEWGVSKTLGVPWEDEARLASVKEAAKRSRNSRLFKYRFKKFLDEQEAEFGRSDEIFSKEGDRWQLQRDFEDLFKDPDFRDQDYPGRPEWSLYKELVPTLFKAFDRLVAQGRAREKKKGLVHQYPGLYPLLRWVWKAIDFVPLQNLHPLLLKRYADIMKKRVPSTAPSRQPPSPES